MIRPALLIATVLALAGCGSSHPAAPAVRTVTVHAVTPTAATASTAPAGYHDMTLLERDLRDQAQAKLINAGSHVKVQNVTCISTGANSAECRAAYSDGEQQTVAVSIAADGNTFITHT